MATSEEVRNAAQGERDRLRDVVASADLTLFAVAAIAVSSNPTFGLLGLVPATLRWRAQKELIVQERLVEDPPRFDFRKQANIDPESWEPNTRFEEVENGLFLSMFVHNSRDIVAWEAAMIDAIERQLGAAEAGELEYVERRGLEAEHLGDAAAAALQSAARRLVELMSRGPMVSKEVVEADLNSIRGEGLREPSRDQIAAVIDLGIPAEGLSGVSLSPDLPKRALNHPLQFFEEAVRANSVSKSRLAEVLRTGTLLGIS